MISRNTIKIIKSLSASKFRQKYNKFIAEGDKLAAEILRSGRFEIETVFALPSWAEANSKWTSVLGDRLQIVEAGEMKQISFLKTPSSVLILLTKAEESVNVTLNEGCWAFLLDGVQDPGNVGTILRLADWFGIGDVWATDDTADFFHPKVVQASMGSICRPRLVRQPASAYVEMLRTNPSYGMSLDAVESYADVIRTPGVVVLGSEGSGLSTEVVENIRHTAFIPGHNDRSAESLNVSMAAAIVAGHIFNLP